MNADACRHLYTYYFSENQSPLAQLPYEQFIQEVSYAIGLLRQQVVHLMSVLRGIAPLPAYTTVLRSAPAWTLHRRRCALLWSNFKVSALQPADRRAGGG
jgi:hypothetical protein